MKIYSKILSAIILTWFLSTGVNAQKNSKPTYIYGHIQSQADSIHLFCELVKSTFYTPTTQVISIDAPVDARGNFKIFLGELNRPARMWMNELVSGVSLCSNTLVDPGDNVEMTTNIITKAGRLYPTTSFSGKGGSKIQCLQLISKFNIDSLEENFHNKYKEFEAVNSPRIAFIEKNRELFTDSLMQVQLAILNRFKASLSLEDYNIIKADLTGTTISQGYGLPAYMLRHPSKFLFQDAKQVFEQHDRYYKKRFITDPKTIAYSINYMRFLLYHDKTAFAIQHNGHNFELKDWCNYLADKYKRALRESLLTYYFVSGIGRGSGGDFIPVVDDDQYGYFLEMTYKLAVNPICKAKLAELMRLRKGAPAFDFNFPIDSTNRRLRLSDLHGKVVLIDKWSYTCGGCVAFATTFHKRIYPLFKDNPHFAYVSIFGNSDDPERKLYKQRLRNVDNQGRPDTSGNMYTCKDYINLYAGNDEPDGPKMNKYYNTFIAPFLLLIGKNGKIYSSKLPGGVGMNDQQINRLIAMIKDALAEKD